MAPTDYVPAPGHRYALDGGQTLQFLDKQLVTGADDVSTLVTVMEGTTNEQVLGCVIDRLQHLNKAFPCRENAVAITHLETALMWLEKRTRDRAKRGVEGKAVL